MGVRFDPQIWASYKRLCQVQGCRPNELLETVMERAVESGSVKSSIESLAVSAEGQMVADEAVVRNLLSGLEAETDLGFGEGDIEDVRPEVDRVLSLLPRIRDTGLIARARKTLENVNRYLNGVPREGGGILTDEEAEKKLVAKSLAEEIQAKKIHGQQQAQPVSTES